MQGNSSTWAPRARSFPERAPARSLGRVTMTRLPWRGRAGGGLFPQGADRADYQHRRVGESLLRHGLGQPAQGSGDLPLPGGGALLDDGGGGLGGPSPPGAAPCWMYSREPMAMRNTRVPPPLDQGGEREGGGAVPPGGGR